MKREVSVRAFGSEINDIGHTFKESDDDRAPKYSLLPTGEKANRVFVVGALTETTTVDDGQYVARVNDLTETIRLYANHDWQPQPAMTLQSIAPPKFVSVVGKISIYEKDGETNVSLQPETIMTLPEDEGMSVRDYWVLETADLTVKRLDDFGPNSDKYDSMAIQEYGGDLKGYRKSAANAIRTIL